MRIYLDACCLNRPFDDQAQDRVRLEAEAVVLILLRVHAGVLQWVSSDIVEYEIDLTPDNSRRTRVSVLARTASERIAVDGDEHSSRGWAFTLLTRFISRAPSVLWSMLS